MFQSIVKHSVIITRKAIQAAKEEAAATKVTYKEAMAVDITKK
jgi:hypothetical protein